MTDAECAAILAEFRGLTLGPELSAALDHAIGVLIGPRKLFGNGALLISPADGRVYGPLVTDHGSGGSITGGIYDGVLMNSRAIDLAAA